MTNEKPIILVTNDDGITSKGIQALIEVAQEFGKVVVVAPDKPQSAMGHAITFSQPLRLVEVSIFGKEVEAYACSGTPVDCVKLAKDKILAHPPALCVSGINHGGNASINIIYSGTMSAAMEAAIGGIPAIGFSLLNHRSKADMTGAKKYARLIIEQMLTVGMGGHQLINVNIPSLPSEEIKGVKICRQADGHWIEDFDERLDPIGRRYYWLSGKFINQDNGTDTDEYALKQGYVSIVPVQFDLTAYDDITYLKDSWGGIL